MYSLVYAEVASHSPFYLRFEREKIQLFYFPIFLSRDTNKAQFSYFSVLEPILEQTRGKEKAVTGGLFQKKNAFVIIITIMQTLITESGINLIQAHTIFPRKYMIRMVISNIIW